MKKLAILSAIALSGLVYSSADAQVRVHLGLNFGDPVYAPAPVMVERTPVVYNDYYYLPDVGAYYSVYEHRYYYPDGGTWVSAAWLPGYRDYDWRSFRRYEIRGARPYMHDEIYRTRYNGHVAREWGGGGRFEGNFRHEGFRDRDQHFENRGWGEGRRDEHFDRGRHEGWEHGEGEHHR